MKVKLLTVLVVVSVLFIGAVVWRVDQFIYGDRLSWVEAQARTQTNAINHALGLELKSLQRVVASLNEENFRKDKFNWTAFNPYYAVASFSVENGTLQPQNILVKEKSPAFNWNTTFVGQAIGTLTPRDMSLKVFVKPFQDANRGRHVALVFLGSTKAYALFGAGELFQSLIDAQKGSLNSFYVITQSGLTVSHSVPEYVGTIMSDDPIFKAASKSEGAQGAGVFQSRSGRELFGNYEQIPGSNLYVISSASLADVMKGRWGLSWQFLLLGAGLLLICTGGLLYVLNPFEKKVETLQEDLLRAQVQVNKQPIVSETTVLTDPDAIQKERMEAYRKVASALGHEMRGPLMSILGYAQMIIGKTQDSEVTQSSESVLRETRAARDILDKLFVFAGEGTPEKNHIKLEGPLARALKNLEPMLANKGVKLVRNFQETRQLDLHVDSVEKAIQNILENAIEAMERMPKKEITIDLFEDAEGVHLNIADRGEGVEPKNLAKIFDPFFTTRSFQNHMGLGLAVSLGVLKEHQAEISVKSERGQGTTVSMLFKGEKTQAQNLPQAPVLKAPPMKGPPPPPPKDEVEDVELLDERSQISEVAEVTTMSPALDVNIDQLLEMPGDDEAKTVVIPASKPNAATSTPAPTAVAPKKSAAFNDDELTFVDGFLDNDRTVVHSSSEDKTVVQSSNDRKQTGAVAAGTPISAELVEAMADKQVDEDMPARSFITPPKFSTAAKSASKLDDFRVEIRRPGKRE
jgi:Signal transduction histidine kinase